MLGLPTLTLDELVKPGEDAEWEWMVAKKLWFCEDQGDKTPGYLKVEAEATSGAFLALSPKCYIFGNDEKYKR